MLLGVVQEQHAERARLYTQWKQFDFPVLQDQVTQLGLAVVPVPIFVDEFGIVQNTRPRPGDLADFVSAEFPEPEMELPLFDHALTDVAQLAEIAEQTREPEAYCRLGDAYLNWSKRDIAPDLAIEAYEIALRQVGRVPHRVSNPPVPALKFRLGVAYRAKFDRLPPEKKYGEPVGAFRRASNHWSEAVQQNPNQYIWRRRIQQYGPRLSKPYPFYDWVETAQQEIRKRGETPIELVVPLSGAEVAHPSKKLEAVATATDPDPERKVTLDETGLIVVRSTPVPSIVTAGEAVRIHLTFVPARGKWNNEAEPLQVWIEPNDELELPNQIYEVANAETPVSSEARHLEIEMGTRPGAETWIQVKGYALYNTCTTDDGQCLFRRLKFSVPVKVMGSR